MGLFGFNLTAKCKHSLTNIIADEYFISKQTKRSKERSVEFVDKNNACAQFIEGKLSTNLIC